MPYPDRTHSLTEGENTKLHMHTLLTDFLVKHTPPGATARPHLGPR
jgi:dipeptidyl-peptidase-4